MLFSFISDIPEHIHVNRELKGILNFYRPHPTYLKTQPLLSGDLGSNQDSVHKKLKQGEVVNTLIESQVSTARENALGEPVTVCKPSSGNKS